MSTTQEHNQALTPEENLESIKADLTPNSEDIDSAISVSNTFRDDWYLVSAIYVGNEGKDVRKINVYSPEYGRAEISEKIGTSFDEEYHSESVEENPDDDVVLITADDICEPRKRYA